MNKQLKQLLTAAGVIFCFIVGMILLINPDWVSNLYLRLFGGVIALICIPFAAGLYNLYAGKPFFKTFLNQE